MRHYATLAGAVLVGTTLAGCSQADSAPGPAAVSTAEAQALDEAATMLDERPAPSEAATGQ